MDEKVQAYTVVNYSWILDYWSDWINHRISWYGIKFVPNIHIWLIKKTTYIPFSESMPLFFTRVNRNLYTRYFTESTTYTYLYNPLHIMCKISITKYTVFEWEFHFLAHLQKLCKNEKKLMRWSNFVQIRTVIITNRAIVDIWTVLEFEWIIRTFCLVWSVCTYVICDFLW